MLRGWLQASTATIYAHRYDAPQRRGDGHPRRDGAGRRTRGVQHRRGQGVGKGRNDAVTPRTRKVLMRSAMTMSPDRGGIFDVLLAGAVAASAARAATDGNLCRGYTRRDFVRAL